MWRLRGISLDHQLILASDNIVCREQKVSIWKTVPESPVPASAPLGLWSQGLLPLARTQPMKLSPWVVKLKFHSNHFSSLGER